MSQQSDVLRYLTERAGLPVYRADMVKDLNLPANHVSAVIARLKKLDIPGEIVNVIDGVYRYLPKTNQNGARLFEQIATTKQGRLVLQDEGGDLFVADPL